MMPNADGFTLCRKIRDQVDCPILFLTAKAMENDVMVGLGEGAGELQARIDAHLRREKRQRREVLCRSDIHFDLSGKKISVRGEPIPFTKAEYRICELLAKNRGGFFSKEEIYESVFGCDGESDSYIIVVHIKNIRAKFIRFQVSPIETAWRIGYKWS